jgi:hypothetical protein
MSTDGAGADFGHGRGWHGQSHLDQTHINGSPSAGIVRRLGLRTELEATRLPRLSPEFAESVRLSEPGTFAIEIAAHLGYYALAMFKSDGAQAS